MQPKPTDFSYSAHYYNSLECPQNVHKIAYEFQEHMVGCTQDLYKLLNAQAKAKLCGFRLI